MRLCWSKMQRQVTIRSTREQENGKLTLERRGGAQIVQGTSVDHVADHEAANRLVLGWLAHAVRAVDQAGVAAAVPVASIIPSLLGHLRDLVKSE